jgi:hypothetical protein
MFPGDKRLRSQDFEKIRGEDSWKSEFLFFFGYLLSFPVPCSLPFFLKFGSYLVVESVGVLFFFRTLYPSLKFVIV